MAAEIVTKAKDRIPRSEWRRFAFKGAKPRPHLDSLLALEKITPDEYRQRKLRGAIGGRLLKAGVDAVTARFWILYNATCSESWGSGVLNDGLRYPPEPAPTPHASRMCQCRSCKIFHPPAYISSRGVCYTEVVNRSIRFHLLLADDLAEVATPGDKVTETRYLPAGFFLPSDTSITTIYAHHPEERRRIREESDRQRRKRVGGERRGGEEEDAPKPRVIRVSANARTCDECGAVARPTFRYCRACTKAKRAEMKKAGYLQPLPPPLSTVATMPSGQFKYPQSSLNLRTKLSANKFSVWPCIYRAKTLSE